MVKLKARLLSLRDLFATAFGCKAGDPMVRDGEARIVIW